MRSAVTHLFLCFALALLPGWASEVPLAAPLTTIVPFTGTVPAGEKEISATLTVPSDAPSDLGVGAFVADDQGRWFQRLLPGHLTSGTHQVRISFRASDLALGERDAWSASQSETTRRAGLFFWSTSASRSVLVVENVAVVAVAPAVSTDYQLTEVDAPTTATTGERWELHGYPQPFPHNPFDPAEYALDLLVTTPAGREQRIPGFAEQPMRNVDRGDKELVIPLGRERFTVRFRPREPGVHRLRLEQRRASGTVITELAALNVSGTAWDGYVRVDATDKRFLSLAGKPFFPIGPNLRAVTDIRCTERLDTKITPDRGTLAYQDYLARLTPTGATAAEIWLSSWNLALEWRGDWPEFRGLGRYSQERAWRFDRILDLGLAAGIRFDVVVNNHGQASEEVDREWHNSAYNSANGGLVESALEFFTDSRALIRQDALRRYLAARYADHPAIMAWKLWSEQDLTSPGRQRDEELLARWHAEAAARWKEHDTYGHPLTTHWSGSYHSVFPQVAALPGLDMLTIDAYHDTAIGGQGQLLAHLLQASTGRRGSLVRFGKPVLVTEYGGQWSACPEPQLRAEHASSGFIALVCGHAGAPMMWWFEWIDQGSRFQPYTALANFIRDEDPRSPQAQSLNFNASDSAAPAASLWCHAWSKPGRLLGYVLEEAWQADGSTTPLRQRTQLSVGDQIAAGTMTIAWWDADRGVELERHDMVHPGGPLTLTAPPWRHHVAFKLWRR